MNKGGLFFQLSNKLRYIIQIERAMSLYVMAKFSDLVCSSAVHAQENDTQQFNFHTFFACF